MSTLVYEEAPKTENVYSAVVIFRDVLVICCASYVSYFLCDVLVSKIDRWQAHSIYHGLVLSLIFIALAINAGDYLITELRTNSVKRLLWHWIVALSLSLMLAIVMQKGGALPRSALLTTAAVGFVALLVNRSLFASGIRKAYERGLLQPERIALIGVASEVARAYQDIGQSRPGVEIVACLELNDTNSVSASALESALALGRERKTDAFLIAIPWSRAALIGVVMQALRQQALPVLLLPDLNASQFVSKPVVSLSNMPAYVIKREPLTPAEQMKKRIFDIIIASICLVLLWPLFVATAIMIKLDSPGPVFFRQRRNGFNNREFRIYKFRTMRTMDDGMHVPQTSREDPRTTVIGALLRKTSIDELPQLFNVLRGEMSIVGPRPHAVCHNETWSKLIEDYALRHHIKPGITGLAQVHGHRGPADTFEKLKVRVQFDLEYIDRWSFLFDLQILAKTAMVVLFQRTAY
jgi:undecaprenyl-phosphate galactose phosphotransferase/putative colanic acid biosynthesis UDP-glucose lipid carrier transferase